MEWKQSPVATVIIDVSAAASLGGAVAFALAQVAPPAAFLAGGLLTSWLAFTFLNHIPAFSPELPLPRFDVAALPAAVAETEELLLTLDMMVTTFRPVDELLLDDVVAALEPDSRVVRLFEPRHVPSAGELREAIDSHLKARSSQAIADASAELSDALAELRRSLR